MKRWQKGLVAAVLVLGAALAAGITATIGWRPIVGSRARPLSSRTFEATPARLARGAYLWKGVTPCLACHSESRANELWVPKPGAEGAGQRWVETNVPWLIVPNITPDRETGAGRWSDDAIARAVREGIAHDGGTIFPMMPYTRLREMSDEDLASLIVYMRTLAPVRNALPKSEVPFPVNRLINSAPQPIDGVVPEAAPEQRGKYTTALAVCEDCHTPRDDQDQPIESLAFGGGTVLQIQGRSPIAAANLTPAADGIPYYTEDLFIQALRTGHVGAREISDVMPWRFYRNMTDEDLKAVFAYLKTLKPVEHYVDNSLPRTHCPRCGQEHGGGERNTKPS